MGVADVRSVGVLRRWVPGAVAERLLLERLEVAVHRLPHLVLVVGSWGATVSRDEFAGQLHAERRRAVLGAVEGRPLLGRRRDDFVGSRPDPGDARFVQRSTVTDALCGLGPHFVPSLEEAVA